MFYILSFSAFTRLAATGRFSIEPLTPSAALLQLIPISPLCLIGAETAAFHLRALRDLVEQAACFRLVLNRESEEDPFELCCT